MALFARFCILLTLYHIVFAVQASEGQHVGQFRQWIESQHLINAGSWLHNVSSVNTEDTHLLALDVVKHALNFHFTYNVKDSYVYDDITRVFLKQTAADGREIFNANLNIVFDNIIKRASSIGHTFYAGSTIAVNGEMSSIDALEHLLTLLSISSSDFTFVASKESGINLAHTIHGVTESIGPAIVTAGYLQVPNGQNLVPVWEIELNMGDHWWMAYVSMHDGTVLELYDWVFTYYTYQIYDIGVNDPTDGGRTIISSPYNVNGSQSGWQSDGIYSYTNTTGNNAIVQANKIGAPNAGPSLDFDYPIDFSQDPSNYSSASVTNLFVWVNYCHDIFYQYGFVEAAGNFQTNNFGRGGQGGDPVNATSLNIKYTNKAMFSCPVDGRNPNMTLGPWNFASPNRDPALDNGIIVHEYTHGLFSRLAGGGNNANCVGSGEPAMLAEGWGDWMATVFRQRGSYNRYSQFTIASYVDTNPAGLRPFPYTTNMTVDPMTYKYIAKYTDDHNQGAVWTSVMWDAYWNMVETWGYCSDLFSRNCYGGNNKILQLAIAAMAGLCNPNFLQMRDQILAMDQIYFNGENYCTLYEAFAGRGMGPSAQASVNQNYSTVVEDYSMPSSCPLVKQVTVTL